MSVTTNQPYTTPVLGMCTQLGVRTPVYMWMPIPSSGTRLLLQQHASHALLAAIYYMLPPCTGVPYAAGRLVQPKAGCGASARAAPDCSRTGTMTAPYYQQPGR